MGSGIFILFLAYSLHTRNGTRTLLYTPSTGPIVPEHFCRYGPASGIS